jgi:hypothetical protein
MPDGKNNTISVKVSDDDLVVIDARCAARGVTRSAWLQSLIADDLADVTEGGRAGGIRVRVDPKMPRGKVALVSPGAVPVVFRDPGPADDCPHPKGRRLKNGSYCGACGTGGLTS